MAAISGYVGNMRCVCVFEAVYVCVCAGQSKTGSIVKAFETLLKIVISFTTDRFVLIPSLDKSMSEILPVSQVSALLAWLLSAPVIRLT